MPNLALAVLSLEWGLPRTSDAICVGAVAGGGHRVGHAGSVPGAARSARSAATSFQAWREGFSRVCGSHPAEREAFKQVEP